MGWIHDENREGDQCSLKLLAMNRHQILSGFLFISILILGSVSEASLLHNPRKLAEHKPKLEPLEPMVSPSPSPSQSSVSAPKVSPAPDPSGGTAVERCLGASLQCRDLRAMTACLKPSLTAPKALYLLVQNDGDIPLKVNVTISHAKDGYQEIQIPKHDSKKIIISTNVGESPSMELNAGNGECRLGAPTSGGNFFQQLRLTPIHGAYFLFSVALIIGATFGCCKLRRARQGDGIPYQELEMGQPETLSANDVEEASDWDEGWDDDWDEKKAVKSSNEHETGNGNGNGNLSAESLSSSPSDRNGWDNDWDS